MESLLIVGLGNVGEQYTYTRHNVGFLVLDALCEHPDVVLSPSQLRFQGLFQRGKVFIAQDAMLLKPLTYMNNSGISVRECASFFKLPPEHIIVIYDDLDQPFGSLRCRFGGGHGGHNGVRDIIEKLGSDKFHRLKVGIGKPPVKQAGASWVLGKFTDEEFATLRESIIPQVHTRLYELIKQIYAQKKKIHAS